MFRTTRRKTIAIVAAAAMLLGSAGYLAFDPQPAQAQQPHMNAAMDLLIQARKQLQQASANKGGHRAKAMNLIDAAMAEVQAGINFAD